MEEPEGWAAGRGAAVCPFVCGHVPAGVAEAGAGDREGRGERGAEDEGRECVCVGGEFEEQAVDARVDVDCCFGREVEDRFVDLQCSCSCRVRCVEECGDGGVELEVESGTGGVGVGRDGGKFDVDGFGVGEVEGESVGEDEELEFAGEAGERGECRLCSVGWRHGFGWGVVGGVWGA